MIEVGDDLQNLTIVEKWETIRDNNDIQKRDLPPSTPSGRYLKLTFEASTDFYGRITIYSMEIFGERQV